MKRDWLLQRVPRITTTVLVTIVLLACATVVNAAEEKQDDRWRFTITPYLWLPSISGSMKLTLPSGLESGSADIDSSLEFAADARSRGAEGEVVHLFRLHVRGRFRRRNGTLSRSFPQQWRVDGRSGP